MDRDAALERLSSLTAGLTPAGAATAADLEAARVALASSLLAHAVDPLEPASIRSPSAAAPTADELAALTDTLGQAAAAAPEVPVPLVFRRSLPAIPVGNPQLQPAQAAGMAARSLGPFADQLGALHWIDIFPPIQQTGVGRDPSAVPFLVLPLAVGPDPQPTTLAVDAGSLWIEAQLLDPAAPAGGYAGILISGGTLKFSAAPSSGGAGLQIASDTTVTLTVKPAGPSGPLGGGQPGADGGAVVAELPPEVTFVFTQAGSELTAVGDASLTAYGSTVGLSWQSAPPAYAARLGQLLIPMAASAGSFSAASVLSTVFQPSGSAPIIEGAWALPVALTPPAQLGAASGAGMLTLALDAGLRLTWQGVIASPVALGAGFVAGAGGVLTVLAALEDPSRVDARITLWPNAAPPSTARSSIEATFPSGSDVYFTSTATSHVEVTAAGATIAAHIDRPLAADGGRLGPRLPGRIFTYQTSSVSAVLATGFAPAGQFLAPIALALHNGLLLTTPPLALLAIGTFTATPAELDAGGLMLEFGLRNLLPTLPDPYAANFLPVVFERSAAGPAGARLLATVLWSETQAPRLSFLDTTSASATLRVNQLAATPEPQPAGEAGADDAKRRAELNALFARSLGGAWPNLFLLDVSSNVDQFGVGMAFGRAPDARAPSAQQLTISGLDVVAPCVDLRVFTAPAVQWEPVVTIPNPDVGPFPSPAGFHDDGGPTMLGAADVTLVPVAPAPLLDQVVSAYDGGAAAAAQFTLPFGMVAVATLPERVGPVEPLFLRPHLGEVQPAFNPQQMSGGRQLSLSAAPRLIVNEGPSSLPGATIQLRNLVDGSDSALQLSVLGPIVDGMFNDEFGPLQEHAAVPVTRIDFSGYGASSFSDWTNPTAPGPAVVQVHFNMITGRASREVVQVKSVLFPWGAIVVRTITIDRQDDTEVFRYDSGWVATTPGTFEVSGFTFHPGAVLGAYNIREIRDTTQVFTDAGGVELVGVYFDADIEIEGLITGGKDGFVPSRGQFGFVQTKPALTPLVPSQLSDLINNEGALGGPVDCVISLAGTGQTMRVMRVEVGNASNAGAVETHEFAAAARGSVVLPHPGSWSVVARTDNAGEPTAVDPHLGVPVIREGAVGAAPSTAPWRLAEPADLWVPDAPSQDYCLLHATDSTRVLFPRPKIETGAHEFTSDQVPLLADGFALTGATSVCPRQDACLAFPDAAYSLQISGAGAFTLAGVPTEFAPSMPQRSLASGSAGTIAYEYADRNGTPSQVAVTITPSTWEVGVKGTNVRLDMTPFNALMRAAGDFHASSDAGVSYPHADLVLGSVLSPLEDLLQFLAHLGLPNPLSLSFANNGWNKTTTPKLGASLMLKLPDMIPALKPLFNTSLGTIEMTLKVGFGNAPTNSGGAFSAGSQWSFNFTFDGTVQVPVFPAVKAGGIVGFGLTVLFPAGTLGQRETLAFKLGVIITIGGDIIPGVLKLQASVAFAFKLVIDLGGATKVRVGVGLIISASGQLLGGLVGISFTAEADGMITVTTPRAVQATFDISVDIQLCWCIDIPFNETVQYTKQLN